MTYYKEADDTELLSILGKSVVTVNEVNKNTTVPRDESYLVNMGIAEIFKRVATDGLDAHSVFRPVAEELAKLAGTDIKDGNAVAQALGGFFADEESNPWKAIVAGKKVDPLKLAT